MAFGRLGHICLLVVVAAAAAACTSVVGGAGTYVGEGPAPTTAEVTDFPTDDPPTSSNLPEPTPEGPDDQSTCLIAMLSAGAPNISYIAMVDGTDPSKTPEVVAQEFDDGAAATETEAATFVDPNLKASADALVAAMRTMAQELRDGTNQDNSVFVDAFQALSSQCGF